MKIKKAQVGRLVKKAVKAIDNKLVKSAGRDIEKSSTKGNFNAIPKSLQKPTTKIEKKIDARAKKIKKDNDSYDQSVWDSYQKNGGKTMKSMKMVGKIKKAQKGITYKNLKMGVRNEQYQVTGQNKDVTPTGRDSANYRRGYELGKKGSKGYSGEGQVEKMGRWEGQNAGKKKGEMGMKVKKAQKGKTLPNVTVSGSTMNRGRKEVKTSPGGAYKMKYTIGPSGDTTRIKETRTLKGLLTGAPKARGVMKQVFKRGGKMSKKK